MAETPTKTTDEESLALGKATHELLEACKRVVHASFIELGRAIAELAIAGERVEVLIENCYAAHGLFLPFHPGENIIILDERARALAEKNHEAQRAADTSTAQHN
jgi:hypothetical protein